MIDLYCGDCLTESGKIPNNSIDLILSDLPYGTIKGFTNFNIKRVDWDVRLNTKEVFNIAKRVLRQNKKMILFAQQPFTTELINNADSIIKYCYNMIWKKNHFANHLSSKKAPVKYFEDIAVFTKFYDAYNDNPLRRYFKQVMDFIGLNIPQINAILGSRRAEHTFYITSSQFQLCSKGIYDELVTVFKIDKMPGFLPHSKLKKMNYSAVFNLPNGRKIKGDVLEYSKDPGGYHSAQKPVKLLKDIIETYTNKGDTVLDLTMGSGSTGVACIEANRGFIGIEIDREYYNVAVKRILKNA